MGELTIINEVGQELITLDQAKNYLRVDFTDDDQLISELITHSRRIIEVRTNQYLVERSFKYQIDKLTTNNTLDITDVVSITSIMSNQTIVTQPYTTNISINSVDIIFANEVELDNCVIDGTMKYHRAHDLVIALYLLIAQMYEFRVPIGNFNSLPHGIEYQIKPHRRVNVR